MRPCLPLVLLSVLFALPARTVADQRRDFMLTALAPGNRLVLDYFGTGGQLTLERRRSLFGPLNDYAFSVNTLLGYSLGQATVNASLRVLFLELSGTLGYRAVWRNLSFEPGEGAEYCKACDRSARRERDPLFGRGPDADRYGFVEGRVQAYAPLNEHVVFTSVLGIRYEGLRPRSYDWFYTNIHDPGMITRWETLLIFKHRDWGGIGPYTQLQLLPRNGEHEAEFAYGFNAVSRLGLVDRNDLLFLTFLMRPGDRYYGAHTYFAPFRALLIYRLALPL